jgi:dsDNA-specific endonuclease/ATPase MutS2
MPEELYFFAQQRNLNAGAFESFLRTLVPAVTGKARRLILADELEAMTELEAGARIVAAMIERLKESDSTIIVVTHMAREISKYTQVRIDGIEARGLDSDYNLVVDRTPRRDFLARSTPELILRRLAETSSGEEQAVYRELLGKMKD